MIRLVVAACALLLAACGGGSSAGVTGPPSAQTVAANDSDWPGLQKCPESGSWDQYLKAEQSKNPSQYQTDKSSWDGLKAGGANDSYIAVYAANTSDCGGFGAGTPTGKVAFVFAVRFKDNASASLNYKTYSKDFHVSDADVANFKAAGGTVKQGSETGLGENSTEVSIDLQGSALYIAFWQNKEFEVAVVGFDLTFADGTGASTKINGRIH